MGFTKKDSVAGTWTKGGVVRMLTNNDINPSNWTVSTFIDNIRPVTSAVTKLIDTRPGKKNLWVYFGTGRYYYRLNNGLTIDDPTNQQTLYGIKEPCYTISGTLTNNCATTVNSGDLTAASATIPSRGWFINLDVANTTYKAERVITDPLAIPSGIVFFTTVAPSSDVCSFGGQTALWFPWFETGGLPPPSALARLEAMLQVSTGSIIKIGFGGTFTNPKVGVSTGIPSKDQGLTVFTPPPPVRRILHMKEK
jgi:type IV pilus assembly protein PilY1